MNTIYNMFSHEITSTSSNVVVVIFVGRSRRHSSIVLDADGILDIDAAVEDVVNPFTYGFYSEYFTLDKEKADAKKYKLVKKLANIYFYE